VVNEGLKYEMELPTYKMVLDKLTQVSKINAICCNAAKAAAQRVYQIKEPCFQAVLLYKFINYSSSSSLKDQHLILPHQNSIQRS
jgi:hypothetical protein